MYVRPAEHDKREADGKHPHREPSSTDTDKLYLQRAQWWPTPETHPDVAADSRRLMGEIHMSSRLQPGMLTPKFKTYVRRTATLS